jgi:hypothetical protein
MMTGASASWQGIAGDMLHHASAIMSHQQLTSGASNNSTRRDAT